MYVCKYITRYLKTLVLITLFIMILTYFFRKDVAVTNWAIAYGEEGALMIYELDAQWYTCRYVCMQNVFKWFSCPLETKVPRISTLPEL